MENPTFCEITSCDLNNHGSCFLGSSPEDCHSKAIGDVSYEEIARGLIMVLNKSPSMYNDQGDVKMLRDFVRLYNKWVTESRNTAWNGHSHELWMDVIKNLEELRALRKIQENLKLYQDVSPNDKIIISVKNGDKVVEEKDGSWLSSCAESLLE